MQAALAKLACFQKFATDLPDLTDMARFCRMVRSQPRHDIGVMTRPDGEFTTSTEEAIGLVMDNSFPDSEPVVPHHENLINLIEVFRRRRKLFLVFEYVDHTVLKELEESSKGLARDKARAYVFQVLRGIDFCHQNNVRKLNFTCGY